MDLFLCKIRIEKTIENGSVKKVSEEYMVDAFSFSEAESIIVEEQTPFMVGEFEVLGIKKIGYYEIFNSNNEKDDKYYNVKIEVSEVNVKNGKEKKKNFLCLVKADSIGTAKKYFDEDMKPSMLDYSIISIKETQIIDFYGKKEEN